jgi:membrane protease subunit HflK
MAWNEPGGSGNKDPWGNRNNQSGPPDLDEVIKKLSNKISGMFGGRKPGGGGIGGSSSGGSIGFGLVAAVLAIIWALSGIYIVEEGKEGVVLQFGAFDKITNPGPHWYPRFIQTVEIVDVEGSRSVTLGRKASEALMLTQDENIVDIKFTIQYKVKNPKDFLFNVRNPDATLVQATESAMREIVGKNKMDYVLKEGRPEVALRTERLVQEILDGYQAGIKVTNLNMQDAQPPEQVQHAFDDVIKAREDRETRINEAEAYANDILPKARGKAARMVQEASAYRDEIVARAEGDASRFQQLLKEYERAPKVTRERLYLETMESVLGKSNKVMVDVKKGNSLIYLPLDKIGNGSSRRGVPLYEPNPQDMNDSSSSSSSTSSDQRDRLRQREVR